ncbi:hypothetical protein BLOT_001827 [Blomia tropicalis]|nr:hypothetical protein BLOT_001827 [Blomia tropicalis]
MSLTTKKVIVPKHNIEQVAQILNNGLKKEFEFVDVNVVDCPDLTQSPFNLAASGLGGKTTIVDVGGPPYLIPLVQRDKIYSFELVAGLGTQWSTEHAFIIGAGAGPFHLVGQNCELMPNVLLKMNDSMQYEVIKNNTHYSKVNDKDEYKLNKSTSTQFSLLGNMFISEGKSGKVLKIEARKRIGEDNFVTAIRKVLKGHYGDEPVSLGGVFIIETGKAKLHIMPDFSSKPLQSDDDVNNWLRFFEMDAPLVCLSVFHSHDPDMDLRIEHTHCFSDHNQGGHYHYDTTPKDVTYLAYFNLAESIVRIDAPTDSHSIGRD